MHPSRGTPGSAGGGEGRPWGIKLGHGSEGSHLGFRKSFNTVRGETWLETPNGPPVQRESSVSPGCSVSRERGEGAALSPQPARLLHPARTSSHQPRNKSKRRVWGRVTANHTGAREMKPSSSTPVFRGASGN